MWLKVHLISGPGPQEHKLKLGIKCKRREAAISGTPCTADTWSWEWVQLGAWGALSTLKQLYRLFRVAMGRCTLAVEMWEWSPPGWRRMRKTLGVDLGRASEPGKAWRPTLTSSRHGTLPVWAHGNVHGTVRAQSYAQSSQDNVRGAAGTWGNTKIGG